MPNLADLSLDAADVVIGADPRLADARPPTAHTHPVGHTAGGAAVTQTGNKSGAVTINAPCGRITIASGALAAGAEASFVVTNNQVAATDVVIVNHASGGTAGAYMVGVGAVGAGSFRVVLSNLSTGSLNEALVLNFAVIRAVAA
jgi:hypothetical protein